jgi:hypothetical protein
MVPAPQTTQTSVKAQIRYLIHRLQSLQSEEVEEDVVPPGMEVMVVAVAVMGVIIQVQTESEVRAVTAARVQQELALIKAVVEVVGMGRMVQQAQLVSAVMVVLELHQQ